MNIRDLQTTLKQRTHFTESREQSFFKLMEEAGQLAEALRTRARYQPSDASVKGTIDEELADVLYALFTLANFYSIDIEQAVTLKEQLTQLRSADSAPAAPAVSVIDPADTPDSADIPARTDISERADTAMHDAPPTLTEELPMTATPAAPSTLDLKAIAQRFIDELWNERKLDVADEIFAENCITNQLRSGTEPITAPRAPAAVKKQVSEWSSAFPDFRYTVRQMISDGDKVMTQCVASGTHQGTWLGIPATGKAITIETMITHRIVDGKIVEDWVLADFLGLFQQLGLVAPLQEILTARKG